VKKTAHGVGKTFVNHIFYKILSGIHEESLQPNKRIIQFKMDKEPEYISSKKKYKQSIST
jgi:hypothetical protein